MGENQKRLRYYLPELTNVLFASHFDSYHVRSLSTLVHESLDYVLSSRDVGYLQPEVQFLTRVLYYIPTVLLFQATPGHVFSGIKPASYDEKESTRKGIRFPGLKRLVYLSLAYSVLPYVYERRDLIFRNFIDLYKVIVAKEDDIILSESINEIDNDEVDNGNSVDDGYVSFWAVFKRAITLFMLLVPRLLTFRYWEVPMRFCNLQLISTAKPVIQMKLDTLSWIAKFQSAFQVYYMMRILGHELDASTAYLNEKIRQPQEEKMDESHPSSVVDEISLEMTPCIGLRSFPVDIHFAGLACFPSRASSTGALTRMTTTKVAMTAEEQLLLLAAPVPYAG
eukprot:gene32926-39822_t